MPTPAKVTLFRQELRLPPDPFEPRYGLRSHYVETFYTPVVGPTALSVLRWADHRLTGPEAVTLDVEALGDRFGVKPSVAYDSLVRLARFQVASSWEDTNFGFPRDLPMLSRHHFNRLSDTLKIEHGLMVVLGEQADSADRMIDRFRELEDQDR